MNATERKGIANLSNMAWVKPDFDSVEGSIAGTAKGAEQATYLKAAFLVHQGIVGYDMSKGTWGSVDKGGFRKVVDERNVAIATAQGVSVDALPNSVKWPVIGTISKTLQVMFADHGDAMLTATWEDLLDMVAESASKGSASTRYNALKGNDKGDNPAGGTKSWQELTLTAIRRAIAQGADLADMVQFVTDNYGDRAEGGDDEGAEG